MLSRTWVSCHSSLLSGKCLITSHTVIEFIFCTISAKPINFLKYSTLSFIERHGAWDATVADLPELHEAYDDYRETIGKQDDDFVNKIHVREDQPSTLYILICICVTGKVSFRISRCQLDCARNIKLLKYKEISSVKVWNGSSRFW